MRTWNSVFALGAGLAATGPGGGVHAQQPVSPPQIVVSASGETRVTPDRAIVSIGVFSRATTAAVAARDNARKQQAIIDTLTSLGFSREQIATVGYNVNPDMRHIPQSGRSEVTGYTVSNIVRLDVRRLEQIGAAIDAALAKGANQIHGLDFYVFNTDEPRRRALNQAIERARLDAESMARAAGGSLGALVEITTGVTPIPVVRQEYAMARAQVAADVPTPVQPGEEVIRVIVTTRWQFVAGGR